MTSVPLVFRAGRVKGGSHGDLAGGNSRRGIGDHLIAFREGHAAGVDVRLDEFAANDLDIVTGSNSQFNGLPLDSQDGNRHAVADDDLLVLLPRKHQHGKILLINPSDESRPSGHVSLLVTIEMHFACQRGLRIAENEPKRLSVNDMRHKRKDRGLLHGFTRLQSVCRFFIDRRARSFAAGAVGGKNRPVARQTPGLLVDRAAAPLFASEAFPEAAGSRRPWLRLGAAVECGAAADHGGVFQAIGHVASVTEANSPGTGRWLIRGRTSG